MLDLMCDILRLVDDQIIPFFVGEIPLVDEKKRLAKCMMEAYLYVTFVCLVLLLGGILL